MTTTIEGSSVAAHEQDHQEEPPPQANPFAQWLIEQRGGVLHAEASEALADVVAAVMEHGKSGSLTLSVKVARNKDGVTVTVSDDLKVKVPQGDRGAAIFFTDDHGNLSRNNPRQPELPLREVPTAVPAELRKANS